jgi:branched-chain amino acid transport system substrate-binding protein
MGKSIRRRTVLTGIGAIGASLTIKRSRAQSAPIKIAFMSPLSGQGAPVGLPSKIGAEAARDHINKAGGVNGRPIELVMGDDQNNPTQAVAILRQFASQGLNLVVGPPNTGPVFAVIGLLPGLQCVCTFTGSPDERITHDMYNRNAFTLAQNGWMRQHAIARAMAEKFPNVKAWTGCHPDVAAGRDGWASFVHAIKDTYPKLAKHEATIVEPQVAKLGSTDYKSQIAALINSPAEGFWTNEYGADGITFYQQAQQFGLSKHFKAMVDYGIDIDLPKALKHNVPTDLWSISYWYYGAYPNNQMAKEVVSAFQAATGTPYPHGFAAMGHSGVMAYAAAIKATGSTETDKVIAFLEGGKWDSVRGTSYFRKEDHQIIAKQNLVRWAPTEEEPGWKAAEYITIDDNEVINPPAPGTKWGD